VLAEATVETLPAFGQERRNALRLLCPTALTVQALAYVRHCKPLRSDEYQRY